MTLVYLGKPEEVLHEGNREGILNLHDWNLILSCHQNVVVPVEYGGDIETSGRDKTLPSLKLHKPLLGQTGHWSKTLDRCNGQHVKHFIYIKTNWHTGLLKVGKNVKHKQTNIGNF